MRKQARIIIEVMVVAILVIVAVLYLVHDDTGSVPDQTNDEMEVAPS